MKHLFNFMKLFLVCLVCVPSSYAFANWYIGTGSVALTNDQTLSQCKAAALQAANAKLSGYVQKETETVKKAFSNDS